MIRFNNPETAPELKKEIPVVFRYCPMCEEPILEYNIDEGSLEVSRHWLFNNYYQIILIHNFSFRLMKLPIMDLMR